MSTWSLLVPNADPASTSVRQEWRELLVAIDDPFMIYQSPEWFDLTRGHPDPGPIAPTLATRRDAGRRLIGLVPLYPVEEPCAFPLTLGYLYKTRPKEMIHIPSGCLLLPPSDRSLDAFFASLERRIPERRIIKISNVPISGPLHRYIEESPALRQKYASFPVPGLSRVHMIPLPSTYDEFLAKYSSKKRYNLRRQFRQLEQHARGGLEFRRHETEGELVEFLPLWDRLLRANEGSPPTAAGIARRDELNRRMARLGLRCCYSLMDGSRPIAAIVGRRYDPIYMLDITRHDPEYDAYSPGACLLHMVIEQLIGRRSLRLINFGYGDPQHDYRTTNVVRDYASYWLIPRTWETRVFQVGYSVLRHTVSAIKRVVPKRTARAAESQDAAPE
jgi:hypothetical protein